MKSSTLITILATFLLVGCSKQQSTLDKQLDEVEKIIEVNPDSASSILENIASPEQLDDKTFARWCMLSGKVTDEIFNILLPSYQFERANAWYSSYGKPNEQVQILIYLGRSYANDGDYDKAMSIYTNALEIGENIRQLPGRWAGWERVLPERKPCEQKLSKNTKWLPTISKKKITLIATLVL